MDLITQGLIGAAAAQAAERRRVGWTATLAGMAAGLAADADLFIRSSGDPLLVWEYHRHFTHSLAFIPLGALLIALLFWLALRRRHPFRRLYFSAAVGFATHGVLDAFTSYGTLLYWPFSGERVSWDILSIVDPIFTVTLLIGCGLAFIKKRAVYALAAIALVCGYTGFAAYQHAQALAAQAALAASRDHTPNRGRAMPSLGNALVWRSVYEQDGRYWVDAIRVMPGRMPLYWEGGELKVFSNPPEISVPPGSVLERDLARFAVFSQGYVSIYEESPLILSDARYSPLPNGTKPLWAIEVAPDAPQEHVKRKKLPKNRRLDSLKGIWEMMLGRGGKPALKSDNKAHVGR